MFKSALFVLVGALAGCGGGALLQCRVDAVGLLPLEPDAITLGDLREVVRRVHACQAKDGGP
jgi:hypothetical protein